MAPSKVRWWHCLPISIAIHAIFIGISLYLIPDSLSSRLYEVKPTYKERIVFMKVSTVYQPEDIVIEVPPAVEIDEDPFEPPSEIQSPAPDIQFEQPVPKTLPKLEPEPEPVHPKPSQTQTDSIAPSKETTAPLVPAPLPPSQRLPHSTPSTADAQEQTQTTGTSQSVSSTSQTNTAQNTLPSPSSTSPSHPDETALWRTYTRQLSAHFKSRRHYPEMAKKLRLTGTVWIILELRRDGTLIDARIKTSSGYPILDQAALTSAKKAIPAPPFPAQTQATQKSIQIPYHYKM